MDFRDSPEEAAFRAELRAWLADHAPREPIPDDPDAREAFLLAWHRKLYGGGWVGLSFPAEYGGRGLPEIYEAIYLEELGGAGAPPGPADAHLAHALRLFGSPEQKARHLPGLLSRQVRWCQGFSEPGAGSDLAGLSTQARPVTRADGSAGYRISGQKIWTSGAIWSQWCMLLARLPQTRRHHGISLLLVPMDTPGVDCRQIVTASGTREFAEVFFDEAEVGRDALLGEEGQGWSIAMALLGYERGPADMGWVARFARTLGQLEAQVRRGELRPTPALRARLARAYVALRALQIQVQRSLSRRAGHAAPGAEGSVDKLLMTRTDQFLHRVMLELRGARPLLEDGLDMDLYFWSRAASIYGGSQQIQRDIVAQRVLDLPRARR
jgi:alkylation response protein AidB-like acyl-CoA dehydrogenase